MLSYIVKGKPKPSKSDYEFKIQVATLEERNRIAAIQEAAYDGQTLIVRELIKSGATLDEARRRFEQAATLEQQLEKAWRNHPGVRAEFRSKENYLAYMKAKARGAVKIFGETP